jgi:phosphatidate cytidylyltransferase
MLKLRILSSLVLVPLVLWALFAWPLPWFAAFIGLFILAGAWEWGALAGLRTTAARFLYLGTIALAGILLFLYPSWIRPLLALSAVFWLWVFIEQVAYRSLTGGFLATFPGKLLSGLFVLVPTWVAVVALRQQPQGEWLSLFLYVLVWGADTGAYFAGYRFGKHKLAPTVSPGKTWEGVAGALLFVFVLALATGLYTRWAAGEVAIWLGLALLTALVSVLGDLFESRIKRVAGVKDSGQLIPGHGGVLDRIDAMTAAAPLFVFAWLLWRQPGGGLS